MATAKNAPYTTYADIAKTVENLPSKTINGTRVLVARLLSLQWSLKMPEEVLAFLGHIQSIINNPHLGTAASGIVPCDMIDTWISKYLISEWHATLGTSASSLLSEFRNPSVPEAKTFAKPARRGGVPARQPTQAQLRRGIFVEVDTTDEDEE